MKKILYYLIILSFALNGAYCVITQTEFSFLWWLGFINLASWGGFLTVKLLDYLNN